MKIINDTLTIRRLAMYRTLIIFLVLAFIQSAVAQIPNAGFENWTNGDLDLTGWWTTTNSTGSANVTPSATAHSGSKAVRGEVIPLGQGYVIVPAIYTGQGDANGFACNQRPVSMTGYYQFYPVASSGDLFSISAILYKGGVGGTTIGFATLPISAAASSYTQFSASFIYFRPDIPDTCLLTFMIMGAGVSAHVGSYFLLDDLAFSGSTGVENQSSLVPVETNLQQNYPNPFNPSTTISYSLSKASYVKLRVYNILGKELTTLADGFQSAGNHTAHFLASNMASGVYFYRLETEGYTAMKQMLLVK
jgi:hypothetical protein